MKVSYTYRALVRHVTDGDTVIADIDLGLRVWAHDQKLRLCLADGRGLDAPEKSGATAERGMAAREHLLSLLQTYAYCIDIDGGADAFEVVVATRKDKQEKYGRWLATLHGEHLSVSVDLCQMMVDAGFAVAREYR